VVEVNGTNITEVYMTLDRLTAVKPPTDPVQCFEGYHNIVVALAMIGICCLYPTAMLTRPMFQGTIVYLQSANCAATNSATFFLLLSPGPEPQDHFRLHLSFRIRSDSNSAFGCFCILSKGDGAIALSVFGI
jgi:hypothetical protein